MNYGKLAIKCWLYPDENEQHFFIVDIVKEGYDVPKDYNFTNSIQSTATATNSQHKVGRSFKFDYKTHRFVFEDGCNVEDTQIEAIKQWIELFIRTEMKKYLIYSDSFKVI